MEEEKLLDKMIIGPLIDKEIRSWTKWKLSLCLLSDQASEELKDACRKELDRRGRLK